MGKWREEVLGLLLRICGELCRGRKKEGRRGCFGDRRMGNEIGSGRLPAG